MATVSSPSRNPFRTNPFTPNPTGNNSSTDIAPPPPSASTPVTAPSISDAERVPEHNLGPEDLVDVDEPPPYTARPAMGEGEITIEQGPRRPFQPAPTPQSQVAQRPQAVVSQPTGQSSYYSSLSSRRDRPGGLLQQLTGALNSVVDSINERTQGGSYGGSSGAQQWNSYPGQQASPPAPSQQQQQRQYAPPSHPPPGHNTLQVPPPLPPRRHSTSLSTARSAPVSPTASSDFARDFYAVGPADDILRREGASTPPPGQRSVPDIPGRPSRPTSLTEQVPDDGRPTTQPVIGHPLLKDGKLLVYPERYECDKCVCIFLRFLHAC